MKITDKLFDRERERLREEFFAGYLRKNSRAYIVVSSVILALELVMIVRGLFLFDFGYFRHLLYFVSYIFLSASTGAALIYVLRNRDGRVSPRTLTLALHLYCTAIIAWALLVSYLDMLVGNTPIVYLTVIMSVAGLSVVHPVYYALNLAVTCAVLLSFGRFADIAFYRNASDGVYFNLAIFGVISVLLAARQYRVSRREYELNEHLHALSFRDQLTDIFNRRMYDEAMERIQAADEGVIVGLFDLDSFKRINDSYGHDFGDACLKEAAAALREAFGEQVYRIGGDEFSAICGVEERGEVESRVDGINRRLEAAFPGRNISVSAGFFLREKGSGLGARELVEKADRALYSVKESGRRRGLLAER